MCHTAACLPLRLALSRSLPRRRDGATSQGEAAWAAATGTRRARASGHVRGRLPDAVPQTAGRAPAHLRGPRSACGCGVRANILHPALMHEPCLDQCLTRVHYEMSMAREWYTTCVHSINVATSMRYFIVSARATALSVVFTVLVEQHSPRGLVDKLAWHGYAGAT